MKIKKIEESLYKEYLKGKEYKFLQSYEQVIYSKLNNRTYCILGMFDDEGSLIKATFVLLSRYAKFFKKAYINMYEFNDEEIDNKFLDLASEFLKDEGVDILYLTTSQSISTKEDDSDIINATLEQKRLDDNIKKLGFQESEYDDITSYSYQYVKNIREISSVEELIQSYKTKDRNKIRKSLKNGLIVEKIEKDRLDEFRELFNKSAVRQGFFEQSMKYFESYYDAYYDSGKLDFLICYLDVNTYFEIRKDELEKAKKKLEKSKNQEEEERKIKSLEDKLLALEDKKNLKIPISCGIFVESKDEYVYFIGGNDIEYTKYLGAYFIQHYAMIMALEKGLSTYNFFGTVGAYKKESSQDGVYIFKRRFNGYSEQLGNYKKVLSKKYLLSKLIKKG